MKSNPIVDTFSQMTPSREFEQVMVEFDNNVERHKEVSLQIQSDDHSMPMKIQSISVKGPDKTVSGHGITVLCNIETKRAPVSGDVKKP